MRSPWLSPRRLLDLWESSIVKEERNSSARGMPMKRPIMGAQMLLDLPGCTRVRFPLSTMSCSFCSNYFWTSARAYKFEGRMATVHRAVWTCEAARCWLFTFASMWLARLDALAYPFA